MLKIDLNRISGYCRRGAYPNSLSSNMLNIFALALVLSIVCGCGGNNKESPKTSEIDNNSSSQSNQNLSHLSPQMAVMVQEMQKKGRESDKKTREREIEIQRLISDIAEAGNLLAQYEVGIIALGKDCRWWHRRVHEKVEPDFLGAIKWLSRASEQGVPSAQTALGVIFLTGQGGAADPHKAKEYFLAGANAGDSEAMFHLGQYFEQGCGGTSNLIEAVKWYNKWKFAQDDNSAGDDRYLMGFQLDNTNVVGVFNVPDVDMLAAAKRGDKKAQYHWAQRLAYKTDNVQDTEEWSRKILKIPPKSQQLSDDLRSMVDWFRLSAEQGYAPAQYELGSIYAIGLSRIQPKESEDQDDVQQRAKEKEEAIKWLMKAAEQGWVRAQYVLGMAYGFGSDELTSANFINAKEWLELAANQGHSRAQYELAELFYKGDGNTRYEEKAIKWYRVAAEQGMADAQYRLGILYEYGVGTVMDKQEALKWYRHAANRLHAGAIVSLARMLYHGEGGNKNIQEARQWFLLGAADPYRGNIAAMYFGVISRLNEGGSPRSSNVDQWYDKYPASKRASEFVALSKKFISESWPDPPNIEEGVFWLKKAAEEGSLDAQSNLGDRYSEGIGVAQDNEEAAKWYRMAADQGDAAAQSTLGLFYETGKGGELNPSEATKWYRRAAEKGDVLAQGNLGCCYSKGQGVPQDYTEAAKWFRKAADKGEATAQYNLGVCYYKGQGVIKDFQSAYGWFLLASAGSMTPATKMLSQVEGKISPSEQRAAREWAQNWRPSQKQLKAESKDKADPSSVAKWTSSGSGFFISDKGYFITANHVVAGASKIVLNTMAGAVDATVVASDSANDVAVLKVNDSKSKSFTALVIPPRSKVLLGQTVFTVGFPNPTLQGINPKLTKGEISALTGIQDDVRAYQVSLPVQPGNSGGVLADEHANVLGIVVQKLNTLGVALVTGDVPQNVNYALKVSYANSLIDSVPGLSESLPQPSGEALSFEKAVQKVQAASALVLSYGQRQDK